VEQQIPLQHSLRSWQLVPSGKHRLSAAALFATPKQANAIPASPTPNLFSACRRVTDWANPLVSSSNLLLILFPFVCLVWLHRQLVTDYCLRCAFQ
jgi:hypothetical protein